MSNVQQYIGDALQRFTEEIFEFLRIPSVSTQSDHDADTHRAAGWLQARMADAGLLAEIIETPGHPIVLGEWREAGEDAPTILVYGHYDVQPAEPLELWDSPPFEPEIRDGRLYARGSADDKGQMYLHVKAAEAHLKAGGGLPVNLIILAEGEEEVGSGNLIPFVEANTDRLACDAVVISDTGMFAPGVPSLLFSLRGLAYCEIHVDGPSADLHSGYGGPIVNPAMALSRILATMLDDEGRIAIDGFYDDVVEWDDATRDGIRSLPFDEQDFAATMGAPLIGGERGYSVAERMWTRPTCEVNGILSSYTGEGAKTVIPATAMAKVSFRLVADQQPQRVYEQVRAHVAKVAPEGVTVRVEEDPFSGNPWRARITGKLKDAATAALIKAFGAAPVLAGEGGSIPIVSEFERILGAPCLLVGFALPGANEHAPNEWLPEENIEKGIRTLAYLYEELR